MQRLFLAPDNFQGDTARITGADHLHLARVLRARVNQSIVLLDDQGAAYCAILTAIGKSESIARIEQSITPPPEPRIFLRIGQALGKGDKFEQVVQHGTEAGASAFVPVHSERCMAEIPANRLADRMARWRLIVKGAAEQSYRARIPKIDPPCDVKQAVEACRDLQAPCLLLHTAPDCMPLRNALERWDQPPEQLTLLIGPEGGWSPAEVQSAGGQGCETISLGPRILRTETAALVAISQILYHYSIS